MKKMVVFSGAGMSQESGIKTFRDMGGLWEEYEVTEVASPEAWMSQPELVMNFYNQRRKQLFECKPNQGHEIIAELENEYNVSVVTQNVDDLHERAGSANVLHLHGELKKVRSTKDESLVYEMDHWELKFGDACEKGSQLRPHIVWFGEAVPAMEEAINIVSDAQLFVVVGTSLNVYPAASLLNYVPCGVPIYLIDPNAPQINSNLKVKHIKQKASVGLQQLKELLNEK